MVDFSLAIPALVAGSGVSNGFTIHILVIVVAATYYWLSRHRGQSGAAKEADIRVSISKERRKRRRRLKRPDEPFRHAFVAGKGTVEFISDDEEDIVDSLDFESLQTLQYNVPESTAQERRRFLDGREGDVSLATRDLKDYLAWSTKHRKLECEMSAAASHKISLKKNECTDNDEDTSDQEVWNKAAAVAMKVCAQTGDTLLHRIARTFSIDGKECTDQDGHRVIKLIPGRMDDKQAPLTVYALAVALYLDRKLARDSTERITILIDVRGGEGWRNLHAGKLVPFIRDTCKLLLSKFPERLARAIVFPVPMALRWIWTMVVPCLDLDTAGRICSLTGPARITSPPPSKEMAAYMDERVVDLLEKERLAAFGS
jgi:CRAL/TRIO domain